MRRRIGIIWMMLALLICTGCGRDTISQPDGNRTTADVTSAAEDSSADASAETASADSSSETDGAESSAQTGAEPAKTAPAGTSAASGTATAASAGVSETARTAGTTGSSQSAASRQTAAAATAAVTTADRAKQIANAKAECDRLAAEVTAAEQKLAQARQTLADAQSSSNAADTTYSNYNSAHQNELALYAQGSFGFFSYVGAADALNALNNAKYASSTVKGDPNDATSLSNMRKSFDFMRECNRLRAGEGLGELRVTDRLMAIAQSDLNWSDKNIAHSQQFNVGENLAWNYPDPFRGWYDEEKASRGGHYLNIVNSSYQTTGFAVCTAGRSGMYSVSHGQVFYFVTDGEQSYTVDEYEARFNAYSDSIGAIQKQLDAYAAAAERARQAVNTASAAVTAAETALQQAQQRYAAAYQTYQQLL